MILKLDNRNIKKLLISIVDNMIPESIKFKMPKASSVVDIDVIYHFLSKDKSLENELNLYLSSKNDFINNKFDFKLMGLELAKNKNINNIISEILLKEYFTSKKVLNQLCKNDTINNYNSKSNYYEITQLIISKDHSS